MGAKSCNLTGITDCQVHGGIHASHCLRPTWPELGDTTRLDSGHTDLAIHPHVHLSGTEPSTFLENAVELAQTNHAGVDMCRAARFCHAAAHGGQVTAPLRLIQQVIRAWTSNGIPIADDGEVCGEALQVQVPDGADLSLLPWPATAPASFLSSCTTMHTLLHRRHQTRGGRISPGGCTRLLDR